MSNSNNLNIKNRYFIRVNLWLILLLLLLLLVPNNVFAAVNSDENIVAGLESINSDIDAQVKNTESLLVFIKKANKSGRILNEIILLESAIYKAFSEITERMRAFTYISSRMHDFKSKIELKLLFSKASSGYLVLSSKYSVLLDAIVVFGKSLEVKKGDRTRYIAFMVENHNRARPQSGTSKAEVFYEVPAEGGITRYMLLLPQKKYEPELNLGPIRSSRDYFLDILEEYNAVYIHCGASKKAYDQISSRKISNLDELQTPRGPFYRLKTRKAPHNLYIKFGKLVNWLKKKRKKYLIPKSSFPHEFSKKIEDCFGKKAKKAVNINLKFTTRYDVTYVYNKKDKMYYRFVKNKQDIDKETNKQLVTKNLVVQFADMKVVDKLLRLKMNLVGSGPAYMFKEGKGIFCTWKKTSAMSPTEYFFGKEKLKFLKGRIDILIMNKRKMKKSISFR
ncbi:DUF3048 domain-containing protein [bacterium]|nr:DUF3048 domain-containing protein [bacterium]